MIIRCTKCSTEFALDPSQVGPEGVTLRCSVCSHMFHAEPDPGAGSAPWKLTTAEKQTLVYPDLRRVLEHIEDGRLRPEDRVSRTGDTWLKLGELPELSALFIGAEGLPRVFRAMETSPAGDLGPPPAFGANVDEVRREETVRFNLSTLTSQATGGGAGATGRRSGSGVEPVPAPPEFDTALPAPPEFDVPTTRRGRPSGGPEARSFQQGAPPDRGRAAPASMLEAVTKAVAGEERKRHEAVPESDAGRGRSQPILVADLARAAAASAEKAVQAVDGQRARERAERAERSTGTFTGAMTRVDPSQTEARAGWSESRPAPRESGPISPRSNTRGDGSATIPHGGTREGGPKETADLKMAAAVARAHELRMAAAREAEPTQLEAPDDANGGETAELTRPPEVVIVKMPEGGRSSSALWALLGVVAAAGIVFGVPSIRAKLFNLGGPTPEVAGGGVVGDAGAGAAADTTPQELEQARRAIRNLGFKESNKVQAALQRVIDDPARSPEAVAQARLTQAELVLMRALACKIAVIIEPAAMGGQAQSRSVEDPVAAQELLAGLDPAQLGADGEQLQRVRALQALVEGKQPGPLPPNSEELAALIKGAPLWRGEVRSPPSGLITMLQRVANPSTLNQSVLALALWRGGDLESARTLLRTILERVGDQPAAKTMLEALDRQDMLAENGDPEVAVPPSDPEPEPTPTPEPTVDDPSPPQPSGDGKVAVRPAGGAAPVQEKVEVLISTGCQKVRQGDPMGVKMLLDAVDRGADPMQNFNLCFCLGAGFARQNSHDAALTWYKRAVSQSPANRDAIAGAARSAELLGRTTQAVDFYKKLRSLDPGNAAAAAYLANHNGEASPPPQPTPPEEPPGELMPIKPKNR